MAEARSVPPGRPARAPRGVIVGCWQLASDHGSADRPRTALGELEALARRGFTTFDCADIYTGVEDLLGALRRRLGAAVPIRVHTKYVPDRSQLGRLSRREVRDAIDRSRRRLGVDALDLVQFHWWDWDVPGYVEAAGWLARCAEEGAVRAIGVTNFDARRLRELLDAGIPIATQQAQYSLVDRRPERGMLDLCAARDVAFYAYGSLAGGFLSDRWSGAADPGFAPANRSLVKYRLILDEYGDWSAVQELLRVLGEVGARRGVTAAGAALRWTLERPGVTAAVVGAGIRRRVDETLAALECPWDDEDTARLDEVTRRHGGPHGDVYELERRPGGRHAAILRTELNRSGGT